MTPQQWSLVERHWPMVQQKAHQAVRRLERSGWRVDEAEAESVALDFLIDAVRTTDDDRILRKRLGLLSLRIRDQQVLARRRSKEVQADDDLFDGYLQPDRRSVTSLFDEHRLPPECRSLLLKVIDKPAGLRLTNHLTPCEHRRWMLVVRPALREWATDCGLGGR